MAHTLPDYSTKYKMTNVFGNIDNNELAVRLGSPDTFYRTGNVVFMDDFEAPVLQWTRMMYANPGQISLMASHWLSGSQSCRLTTDAVAASVCGMYRYFQTPIPGKMGMEISFTVTTGTTIHRLAATLYTGTKYYQIGAEYDHSDHYVKFQNSSGSWESTGTAVTRKVDKYLFHSIKVIFDTTTEKYNKIIFENTTYDLSTEGLHGTVSAEIPHIVVYFDLGTGSANSYYDSVDNFILTQNEL